MGTEGGMRSGTASCRNCGPPRDFRHSLSSRNEVSPVGHKERHSRAARESMRVDATQKGATLSNPKMRLFPIPCEKCPPVIGKHQQGLCGCGCGGYVGVGAP